MGCILGLAGLSEACFIGLALEVMGVLSAKAYELQQSSVDSYVQKGLVGLGSSSPRGSGMR